MKVELENVKPMDIEKRSFEIITEELGDTPLIPGTELVVKRCIHTSADFDYAKNLCFSENAVEKAIQGNKAHAVIVSVEASDNTKKKFKNKCEYYKIPLFYYGTTQDLGKATGNKTRMSLAVVDEGFSKSIIKMLDNQVK